VFFSFQEEVPGECARCSLRTPILPVIAAHQFLLYYCSVL